MQGFITTRHLFTHAPIIVGEFGWRVYLRCVAQCILPRRRPATFLSVMSDAMRKSAG
jgi:hypothetical protein